MLQLSTQVGSRALRAALRRRQFLEHCSRSGFGGECSTSSFTCRSISSNSRGSTAVLQPPPPPPLALRPRPPIGRRLVLGSLLLLPLPLLHPTTREVIRGAYNYYQLFGFSGPSDSTEEMEMKLNLTLDQNHNPTFIRTTSCRSGVAGSLRQSG